MKVGVSRPFGELENGRGLTREIVPANHYVPRSGPNSKREVEIRSGRNELLRVMEPANLYPKVNQRQSVDVRLIPLKIAGDGAAHRC